MGVCCVHNAAIGTKSKRGDVGYYTKGIRGIKEEVFFGVGEEGFWKFGFEGHAWNFKYGFLDVVKLRINSKN